MVRYPAKFIAEFFIRRASEEGKDLTHLHIQKLTFLAHGYLLGKTGRPLIKETIEAWPYGPVIPELYTLYCKFGKNSVSSIYPADSKNLLDEVFTHIKQDTDVIHILESVWEVFKHKSGMSLTALTHEPDSPWDICYKPLRRNSIPNDVIEEFYSQKKHLKSIENAV